MRIPKEFEGEEVLIARDEGGRLTLEPVTKKRSLVGVLDWLKEQGPMPDFTGDPGDDDLLPLDDIKL